MTEVQVGILITLSLLGICGFIYWRYSVAKNRPKSPNTGGSPKPTPPKQPK